MPPAQSQSYVHHFAALSCAQLTSLLIRGRRWALHCSSQSRKDGHWEKWQQHVPSWRYRKIPPSCVTALSMCEGVVGCCGLQQRSAETSEHCRAWISRSVTGCFSLNDCSTILPLLSQCPEIGLKVPLGWYSQSWRCFFHCCLYFYPLSPFRMLFSFMCH